MLCDLALRRGVCRCPRCVPTLQTVFPILRRQRLVARPVDVAPRRVCVRLLPAASRGAARDVVTSPRAMPHRVPRASHSGPAACKVRPLLLRRAATSEDARVACPIGKPFSRFSTGKLRCPAGGSRLTISLRSSPAAAALQRRGALMRAAAASADNRLRAQFANRSPDFPPAAPRCPAVLSRPT